MSYKKGLKIKRNQLFCLYSNIKKQEYIPFYKYNNDVENEYFDKNNDFFLCLVEQKYINASEIIMGEYEKSIEFPWHGHSYKDFVLLNEELENTLHLFQKCNNEKEATRLKRKYKTVYNAYYLAPICLTIDSQGRYHFGNDGRHRIFVARQKDNVIPVWITEYRERKDLSFEEYKMCHLYGEWRFTKIF